MEQQVLTVEPRTANGKGGARKARAIGKIPGILYGHKARALPFAVDPAELQKQITGSGMGRNTVLHVRGLERDVMALLKDTQVDPVKRSLVHIDLIEVREDEEVTVDVPIELTGKSKGVVNGGILQSVRRAIRVVCTPLAIPKQIAYDVTEMDINDTLHVSDIILPAGTRLAMPGKLTIATVAAPAAEEEAAAAGAEGAPAGEGATAAPAAEKK